MESMQERRSEVRLLCADLIQVRWKDQAGKKRTAQAILEDISPHGACLQMEVPVPLGLEIGWRSPNKQFMGTVRYCVYREIGYFLGVQFDHASQWSRRAYRPQHLLDLRRLIKRAGK